MKTAVLAAIVSSAAAFAPTQMGRAITSINSSYENEIGALPPTGFFDPAKLSDGISQEKFDQYRLAELKHGRAAMLAVLGYVAPETYRFGYDLIPGELSTYDIPNGVAAINAIPFGGWVQMIAFVGTVEAYGWFTSPTGVLDLPDDILAKRQTAELQHGRLAMLAFLELIRHDSQNLAQPGFDGLDNLITGLPFLYN